jgi:chromate transporter
VTFVPCFLWIFVGGPYIEALRGNTALSAALSAITAAVVGVVLNLAVWFALHVVFGEVDEMHLLALRLYVPVWSSLKLAAFVLAAGSLVAMLRFKVGMMPTLGASTVLGAVYYLAF